MTQQKEYKGTIHDYKINEKIKRREKRDVSFKTSMAFQTYFLIHDRLGKKNFHFRFNLIKFGVDFKRLLLLLLFVYLQRLLHVEITN